MSCFLKISLFLTFLWPIFSPAMVWGSEPPSIAPAMNPICWEKEACVEARQQFGVDPTVAAQGWLEKEAPCDKSGWGKCLPAGQTETTISFGGTRKFTDIGAYIKTVYNYALSIASILAVVVIILAGAQWITSGGSTERISSAKKRIGGALIGLAIAYLSYVILNTINPALVNLRLPQVYLIRPKAMAYDYCSQMPADTKLATIADASQGKPESELKGLYQSLDSGAFFDFKPKPPEEFVCNKKFFVKDADGATCWGDYCWSRKGKKAVEPLESDDARQMCVRKSGQSGYGCVAAAVAGSLSYSRVIAPVPLASEGWDDEEPADIGETELWVVCDNGSTTDVTLGDAQGYNTKAGEQTFLMSTNPADIDKAIQGCGGQERIKGFALMVEMNEYEFFGTAEEHLIGWNHGGQGVDLGDEAFFDAHAKDINKKWFISREEIDKGLLINISANQVYDMDEDDGSGPEHMAKYKYLLQ